MSNNPFDLENYVSQINLKDIASAAKNSYQQSRQINRRRAEGIEPQQVHLPGSRDVPPQKFAIAMPVMPKHDAAAAARARRAKKKKEGKS